MKRFKLQCGTVIKVDDVDAYLLRSYVWRYQTAGKDGKYGTVAKGARGDVVYLARYLTGANGRDQVVHLNGDWLDFRRANLKVLPLSKAQAWKNNSDRQKIVEAA